MIRTVTLNPALDLTLRVPGFRPDGVNRVVASRLDPGGKGVNVSKAAIALGGRSVAYAILGGENGRRLAAALDALSVPGRFAFVEGETRMNVKLDDPEGGTHADLNQAGPALAPEDLDKLGELVFADLRPGDVLVLSGSLPAGVPPGVYADWIVRARAAGAMTVLDASGEALALGLRAGPDLAKPNREELEQLAGGPLGGPAQLVGFAMGAMGAERGRVVLSLGEAGAVFAETGRAYLAEGIRVEAKSTVGAGDTMVAALALALEAGRGLEEMIAPAVGAATAAVMTSGSAACDPAEARRYADLVRFAPLEAAREKEDA